MSRARTTLKEPVITGRIDRPELLKIPEIVNVSIATGTRIMAGVGTRMKSFPAP